MELKLITALDLAAKAHATQHRKSDGLPYINHIVEVLNIMLYGKVTDMDVLVASVLHDTLEDTDLSRQEIMHKFGARTLALINEVSEGKSLPHQSRKRAAIEDARAASTAAQHIKLADLISNMSAIPSWTEEKIENYLVHCEQVIKAISNNSNAASFRLLELANFYLQAQKVGCEIYDYLSDRAYDGGLYWAEALGSFVRIDSSSGVNRRGYVVLSLNNQSYQLGLLRNFKVADTDLRTVVICGEYDPVTGNKELFQKPLSRQCVRIEYRVAPTLSR